MKYFLVFLLVILFVFVTYFYLAGIEWLLGLNVNKHQSVKKEKLSLGIKYDRLDPKILTLGIKRLNHLYDGVDWKQTPQDVVARVVQSNVVVDLDTHHAVMGISTDELSVLGGVYEKPSQMEQIKFENAIWKAYFQCFITYDEALLAIENHKHGLLRSIGSEIR